MSAPITNNNQIEGVIVLEITSNKIDQIVAEKNLKYESGKSYLVGEDFLMRSNVNFIEKDTLLNFKVDTQAVKKAFAHQEGIIVNQDFKGNEVFSAYAPLEIKDLDWALISEVDEAEIMSPINSLLKKNLIVFMTVILLALLSSFFMIRFIISRPLYKIRTVLKKISEETDLRQRVDVNKQDEIGKLAYDLNQTIDSLVQIIEGVKSISGDLKKSTNKIKNKIIIWLLEQQVKLHQLKKYQLIWKKLQLQLKKLPLAQKQQVQLERKILML